MSICVDKIQRYPKGLWCHLWSLENNIEELHSFAQLIGLKKSWFQDRKNFPHYDLTPNKRRHALNVGAEEMSLRDWVKLQLEKDKTREQQL